MQLNGWFATPSPVRLSIVAPTKGPLVIRVDGPKGSQTVLEASPDFVKWTAVQTKLTLPFEDVVPDSTGPKAPFYRVSSIPQG